MHLACISVLTMVPKCAILWPSTVRNGGCVQFFRATVKGLKSDEDLETVITLRVPGSDYDKVSSIGKLVKQVLVLGVFTEDEFLAFNLQRARGEESSDAESRRVDSER